jgi:hypothetical protein
MMLIIFSLLLNRQNNVMVAMIRMDGHVLGPANNLSDYRPIHQSTIIPTWEMALHLHQFNWSYIGY